MPGPDRSTRYRARQPNTGDVCAGKVILMLHCTHLALQALAKLRVEARPALELQNMEGHNWHSRVKLGAEFLLACDAVSREVDVTFACQVAAKPVCVPAYTPSIGH